MQCTKISPEFECQGQRSRSPGTKNALSTADTPQVHTNGMPSLQAACSSSRWVHFMAARGCSMSVENQRMLSSFGNVQSLALVWKKLDLTQQKHTFTNQNKCTTTQNIHQKLKPGLVASYNIRPGNGQGLFWFWHFINLSLSYLANRHLAPEPHRAYLATAGSSECCCWRWRCSFWCCIVTASSWHCCINSTQSVTHAAISYNDHCFTGCMLLLLAIKVQFSHSNTITVTIFVCLPHCYKLTHSDTWWQCRQARPTSTPCCSTCNLSLSKTHA